ncbi:MAG: hypothetical protein M1826_000437 [Phylliscum demangeonii]|nr:MAG: hypothetical protein M1826_000437 [Phylliscum demangeonii]
MRACAALSSIVSISLVTNGASYPLWQDLPPIDLALPWPGWATISPRPSPSCDRLTLPDLDDPRSLNYVDLSHVGNLNDPHRALLELCVRVKHWRATKTGGWLARAKYLIEYNQCIDDPKNKIPPGQSQYARDPDAEPALEAKTDSSGQPASDPADARPPSDPLAAIGAHPTVARPIGLLPAWAGRAPATVRALSLQMGRLAAAAGRATWSRTAPARKTVGRKGRLWEKVSGAVGAGE